MIRKAVFAGTWYPVAEDEVKQYLDLSRVQVKAFGALCPHAGWIYSGKTAGKVFSSLQPADTYVLIGPNHSGVGSAASLFGKGAWELPLGRLPIDDEMTGSILKESEFVEDNPYAHGREHSLEVQCPFILMANRSAKIVPILMKDYHREICADIGRAIAKSAVMTPQKKVIIIASSDMSHYEPSNLAKKLDEEAIERMIAMDPDGLLTVVERKGISMCGAGPVATMLYAAKHCGAKNASLVDYSHSGIKTGDNTAVVGYAGIIVT